MQNVTIKSLTRTALPLALLLAAATSATPAYAVNKDMVQLQTEVAELQKAVAALQQSNDERMGALKDLVGQSVDSTNKMSSIIIELQKSLLTLQSSQNEKSDQLSHQIQSLNDSVDELKARMSRLEKATADIQSTQQTMNANLQNLVPPATTPAIDPATGLPIAPSGPGMTPATTAPSVKDIYTVALNEFNGGKDDAAIVDFNALLKAYPNDPLAGNAYFYLGEISHRSGKFADAIKNYNKVFDLAPADTNKITAAHLHKGDSYCEIGQRQNCITELRGLIQRFPNSSDAALARGKLNGMSVRP